jgi:murein DD-endopeptidase MepM/ murein hydrolase activator NlpD
MTLKRMFTTEGRITQYFSDNSEFYEQFDLWGHEGLDQVPTGLDWTVLAPFRGRVMSKYVSNVYGNTLIIFNEDLQMSTRIAHLAEVYTQEGLFIGSGAPIGKMGNTPVGRAGIGGKEMAAHVHINMIPMKVYGEKLHPHNGFKGRVDPVAVLHMLEVLKNGG